MFSYLKINFTWGYIEEKYPVIENISIKKGVFPFLDARILAPMLVYWCENHPGYTTGCSALFRP